MSITPFDPTKPSPPMDLPVGMYTHEVNENPRAPLFSTAIQNLLALYGYHWYMRGGVDYFVARAYDPVGFKIWPSDTVETLLASMRVHEART